MTDPIIDALRVKEDALPVVDALLPGREGQNDVDYRRFRPVATIVLMAADTGNLCVPPITDESNPIPPLFTVGTDELVPQPTDARDMLRLQKATWIGGLLNPLFKALDLRLYYIVAVHGLLGSSPGDHLIRAGRSRTDQRRELRAPFLILTDRERSPNGELWMEPSEIEERTKRLPNARERAIAAVLLARASKFKGLSSR